MNKLIAGALLAIVLTLTTSGISSAAWDHDPGDSWGWFACCYW